MSEAALERNNNKKKAARGEVSLFYCSEDNANQIRCAHSPQTPTASSDAKEKYVTVVTVPLVTKQAFERLLVIQRQSEF